MNMHPVIDFGRTVAKIEKRAVICLGGVEVT